MNREPEAFWNRASKIIERSRIRDPIPKYSVIPIVVIKYAIFTSITQSIIMAIVLTANYGTASSWFYPIITMLQCGWFWDNATSKWGKLNQIPVPVEESVIYNTRSNRQKPLESFSQGLGRLPEDLDGESVIVRGKQSFQDLGHSTTEDYKTLAGQPESIFESIIETNEHNSEELKELESDSRKGFDRV